MAKYQFQRRARISGCSPEVAVTELEKIHKKHGALSPGVVVDEARPEDNPLHPVFEWDDFKAAEAHRRTQAQDLIYCVEIIPEEEDAKPIKVYTYIPSASSYIPTDTVVNNVDLYQEAWQQFAKRFAEALYSLRRFEEIAQKQNSEHSKLINKAANAMIQLQRQLTTAITE